MKIFAKTIDDKTKEQLSLIERQKPFEGQKIRIMPDCHSGKGCVIGFTSTLGDKVIPHVVGVDIGCGVMWDYIGEDWINFETLDEFIKENIPCGRNVGEPLEEVKEFIDASDLKCKNKLRDLDRIYGSLGTLGGGNHFIEIDENEDGHRFLVVHTGSRNLGKQVAEIYQQKAIDNFYKKPNDEFIKTEIARLKAEGRQREIQRFLKEFKQKECSIPKELCYLEGEDMEDYLHDMRICQRFAHFNRQRIMDKILEFYYDQHSISYHPEYHSESVHNYIDFEDRIIRKGAIKATKGEDVIIPLNMRDGCILGVGKGSDDWNHSAPHGAGRLMSRSGARRELKLSNFKKAMDGIYTTTATEETIDESPMAYKNAKEIIDIVKNTISIAQIIKPIYNFKAEE